MQNKTGAKIAQKGAAFVLAFALGLNAAPIIANASVHPTNVQVVEDESKIKDQRERDVKNVSGFVAGLDLETIRKAIKPLINLKLNRGIPAVRCREQKQD